MEPEAEYLYRNPHYCSTGWSLYDRLAESQGWNPETKEMYPEEMFKEMFDEKKYRDCIARLEEHFETCAQCSLADVKSPPTPVR
jgi:hypothetical protein